MHSRRQVYEGDLVMGFIAFLLKLRGVRVASCAQAGMALVKVRTGPAARPPPLLLRICISTCCHLCMRACKG